MTLNEAIRKTFPGSYAHVAESGDTLFVQHLIVTDAAKSNTLLGTGYKIARCICKYADARNLPIIINAERVDNFNTDEVKLGKLYTRLGFVMYQGVGAKGMIRYPRYPDGEEYGSSADDVPVSGDAYGA